MKYFITLTLFFLFIYTNSQNGISNSKGTKKRHIYRSIEEAVKQPDSVFILILEKKNLDTVPKELLLFKNLTTLNLSFNNIHEIPT